MGSNDFITTHYFLVPTQLEDESHFGNLFLVTADFHKNAPYGGGRLVRAARSSCWSQSRSSTSCRLPLYGEAASHPCRPPLMKILDIKKLRPKKVPISPGGILKTHDAPELPDPLKQKNYLSIHCGKASVRCNMDPV